MVVDRRAWSVVGLIGSIHFVQHVFRILPPLLPVLALAFPYPLWQLGALVSLYFAGSGFGQAPMGMLADRYDRRLLVPPSVATMGVGYLVFALAPRLVGPEAVAFVVADATFTVQFLAMGAGALVAGLGASAIHPCGYPLVIANAAAGREGRAFGAWGSAAKLGDAAAPLAIAALVLVVSWSEVFLLFGVVGVLYAVALLSALSSDLVETRPGDRRSEGTDERSEGTSASGDDAEEADATADGERTDDAATGASGDDADGAGTDGPTAEEADAAAGWRDDRRHYVYPFAALFVFFVARAFSEKGLKAFLPTFVATVYGYSLAVGGVHVPAESIADVYFTAVFLVAAVTTLFTGWLVDRLDPRVVLIAFFVAAAATLGVLATGQLGPLALLAVLVVLGASNWGWNPARDAIMGEITPPDREGRTFGYLHTVSHLFSAVAPVAIGFVAGASSLRQSFLYLAAVMLVAVAAIAALFSRRVYRPVDYGRTADSE
ncbi:MAG: MFS transporter [Haloferacaceae archaeon]